MRGGRLAPTKRGTPRGRGSPRRGRCRCGGSRPGFGGCARRRPWPEAGAARAGSAWASRYVVLLHRLLAPQLVCFVFGFVLTRRGEEALAAFSVSQIMNVDLSCNAISIARLTNHSFVLVFSENKNVRSKRPSQQMLRSVVKSQNRPTFGVSRSLALFGLLI